MTDSEKLKILRLYYAGMMVDSAANFERTGVVDQVVQLKAAEQKAAGVERRRAMNLQTPRQVFEVLADIFGCAAWQVSDIENGGVEAVTTSCLACAIAKKKGAGRPCSLYCIGPFDGLAASFEPPMKLDVMETMWDGKLCRFRMVKE